MDRRKTNDTFHLFSRIKMKRIKNADLNGSQRIHKEYSTYSSDPATFVRFEKIAECLETNAFSIATNREYRIEQRPRKKQVKMARRKMAEIAVAKFECCSRNLAKKTRMKEWIRRRRRRKQGCFYLSLFLFFFPVFLLCQRFTREASSCRCAAQWRPERLANEKENGQIFCGKCRLERIHHRPNSSNNRQLNVSVLVLVHFAKKI